MTKLEIRTRRPVSLVPRAIRRLDLGRRSSFCLAPVLTTISLPAFAADLPVTNATPHHLLLTTPLAQVVEVPTNEIPASLHPPARLGVEKQTPDSTRGTLAPRAVLERRAQARRARSGLDFFPAAQPSLMPYLSSQDQYGNTAIKPGPLLTTTPLDVGVQQGKYWASEAGLNYSLQQTATWVSLTDVMQGDNTLGFYSLSFSGKWTIYDDPATRTAGWVSAEVKVQQGLGGAAQNQSPQRNLGSAVSPAGIWSDHQGVRLPELAWQQSVADGNLVVVAGMLDQGNYLDVNSYANSGRGQFLNAALINSMVVPLSAYNLGVNLQWQPADEWYFMLGDSVGNAHAGVAPWVDSSWDDWSLVGEIGYAPRDFLGLGPGAYRLQPFVGQVNGDPVQIGLGLNFQQQLGRESRFGWFGRFGHGGTERFHDGADRGGTGSQIGTGFVMRGPLEYARLLPSRANDAAGFGFVWTRPTAASAPVYHENEYAFEVGYVLQLTPTTKLQPDLQVVWNASHNPDPGPATVFQLQLDLAW